MNEYTTQQRILSTVAKFIVVVPDWGNKGSGQSTGCRTGPPGDIYWQAGKTTLCRSQLYLPFSDYEFGWSSVIECIRSCLSAYVI